MISASLWLSFPTIANILLSCKKSARMDEKGSKVVRPVQKQARWRIIEHLNEKFKKSFSGGLQEKGILV